ncbi:hypothetical protein K4F52_010295, partial [Lecanicillium sp. MT-2017a]
MAMSQTWQASLSMPPNQEHVAALAASFARGVMRGDHANYLTVEWDPAAIHRIREHVRGQEDDNDDDDDEFGYLVAPLRGPRPTLPRLQLLDGHHRGGLGRVLVDCRPVRQKWVADEP